MALLKPSKTRRFYVCSLYPLPPTACEADSCMATTAHANLFICDTAVRVKVIEMNVKPTCDTWLFSNL